MAGAWGRDSRSEARQARRRAAGRWMTGAAAFLLLLPFIGCATAVGGLPVDGASEPLWCCTRGDAGVTAEYLGAGGWLFRMEGASILTAPFFSNPDLLDVGFGRIEADTALIDAHLPYVRDVDAILVGHAHYDHLMDVPYILRKHAPEARMFGSRTAVNILLGDDALAPHRLVGVEDAAGDVASAGEWFYVSDGRVRFMALHSGHAPHFLGIHLYEGQVEEPAETLPDRAGEWVEGTPLAYLIDFLSPAGDVVYRIHYQDAASQPPGGFPPPLDDGVPVDMAILCAPGYQEVTGYPEATVERLRPVHVLAGHWEDFFRSPNDELRVVRGTDLRGFLDRLEAALPEGARWALPEPGSRIRVAPAAWSGG